MKSSVTSQKYSWPGNEQNQVIQVNDDVGVEEAEGHVLSTGLTDAGEEEGSSRDPLIWIY